MLKRLPLFIVIGSIFLCNCDRSYSPVDTGSSDSEKSAQNSEMLVLGKKLENPYSVKNMLRARDSLEAKGILSKSAIDDGEITTTDLYVRFKPENDSQYTALNSDSSLILFDYPLDYEIAEGGTCYRDPEIPPEKPSYLYTTINIDDRDKQTCPYEVLDELFLEPEDSGELLLGKVLSGDKYRLLEQEALRITGNVPQSDGLKKKNGICKWRPAGSIRVTDGWHDGNFPAAGDVPLKMVPVRIQNWFRVSNVITDGNGNFRADKEFIGDVAYSVRWQYPNNKFDIRPNAIMGQAFFNGPNNSKSSWNLRIESGKSWRYAHVFRAAAYYCDKPFGLEPKFDEISIAVIEGQGRSGQHPANGPLPEIGIYTVGEDGKNRDSQRLFSSTIHELAHEAHYRIRGGDDTGKWREFAFWTGVPIPSVAGLIGYLRVDEKVVESWAMAVASFVTHAVYGMNGYGDFKQWATYEQIKNWGEEKYTPLAIDLIDTYDQRAHNNENYPIDRVSGYTLEQIQGTLKTTTSWNDWRDKIKAIQNQTSSYVDELFKQYDNF